jgi:hypothetical protein
MGFAFPPRRFVTMAMRFGSRAYVDSICKEDWSQAIRGITDKLVERLPSTCFPQDLSFDMTDDGDASLPDLCMANCVVVETLSDDRVCPGDPTCPQAWCPPLEADEAYGAEPCVDPAGGACEPLKRDLGTVTTTTGLLRRQCLLRQATRHWGDRGYGVPGCVVPPDVPGWYYEPRDWSMEHCPQVIFCDPSGTSLIELGSTADLWCVTEMCPGDRQCGSLTTGLDSICCVTGEACVRANDASGRPDETIPGVCCPVARACGQICCWEGTTCLDPGSGACG